MSVPLVLTTILCHCLSSQTHSALSLFLSLFVSSLYVSFILTYCTLEYYITTDAKTIGMFCSCYDSFHTCNDREINNSCSGFNLGIANIQFELYISRV